MYCITSENHQLEKINLPIFLQSTKKNSNFGKRIILTKYFFVIFQAWNINWETKHMMIQFDDDKSVIFNCLSADCKVVHEFIGGYIFLSMRSKDANQSLNEEMFHKLTGGWV